MDAQAADRARVGVLSLHSADQERAGGIGATAFRAGMQALGYTEPQNLVIQERHANGSRDRLRSLANELVAARVQVIVTVGTDATQAAKESTSSIPIVMAAVGSGQVRFCRELFHRPAEHARPPPRVLLGAHERRLGWVEQSRAPRILRALGVGA